MCNSENVKKKINSAKKVYGDLFKIITENDLGEMSAPYIDKKRMKELYEKGIIELPSWEKDILEV